jgi:hypothetical protein
MDKREFQQHMSELPAHQSLIEVVRAKQDVVTKKVEPSAASKLGKFINKNL